jgi:hypothetical protein
LEHIEIGVSFFAAVSNYALWRLLPLHSVTRFPIGMAALFSAYMSGMAFSGICKNREFRTVFGPRFDTKPGEIIAFSYSLPS